MGQIILLAFGAAFFPTLLACVAIMIAQPKPPRLLLGFYLGGLTASVVSGLIVLSQFNKGNEVLGNSTSSPDPGVSIVAGILALLLAWLMISERGRRFLARQRSKRRKPKAEKGPSWAERHLSRANAWVAFAVGAAINLPGPFYLLALGDISSGGYTTAEQVGLILLFNAIMFLLVEVPLIGYLFRPETTAERVAALSKWLNANGLRVMGAIVGICGIGLIIQGITAAS
jgi:Sap, sulfolipid-1-addressing protein